MLALVGIALILWLDSHFMQHADMPTLRRDMSYGLLVFVGFLTSFHCVGMCGPLVIGYTTKQAAGAGRWYAAHLLYGIGKTLSYTLIGGLFGAFGEVIAFTPFTKGVVGMAAGLFLVLFGLHMLNVFPSLRHFQIKTPKFLLRFVGMEVRKHHNPFIIGLLNGLMIICGPLQAMYVMAAGAGSWSEGAVLLFFFAIGTLPLMLGFGVLTSLLSVNLTPKLLKVSGVIVILLGTVMLNRGLVVTGMGVDMNALVARASYYLHPAADESSSSGAVQAVYMEVLAEGYVPHQFTLRKGVPVKWVINAKEMNDCNNSIVVPRFDLKIQLKPGLQTVEFMPDEIGVFSWSCSMGMVPGTFTVVDNVPDSAKSKLGGLVSRYLNNMLEKITLWAKEWQRQLSTLSS